MSRNIILFAPRTGSSYLSNLVASATNTHFYSEHWVITQGDRPIQMLYGESVTSYHNPNGANLQKISNFYIEALRRLNHFDNTDNWTIKMHNFYAGGFARDFIERQIQLGSNIMLTHRRDIAQQFLSFLNAAYRQSELGQFPNGFIYTTKSKVVQYNEINFPTSRIAAILDRFILEIMLWRSTYEAFKGRIKIISYENNIMTNNLAEFGISDQQVSDYNNQKDHLIPTPNNVPIYKDNVWAECVKTLNTFQHVVDI